MIYLPVGYYPTGKFFIIYILLMCILNILLIIYKEVKVMNYRKFIKYIKSYGFHFYRSCKSSHDLYINEDKEVFAVPKKPFVEKGLVWNFNRKYVD